MEGFVGRVNFTDAMDAELCQQAIVVNPFATTWDNLLNACKEHVPAFSGIRVSKTLRDRLLLLLKKRAACNAAEEKAQVVGCNITFFCYLGIMVIKNKPLGRGGVARFQNYLLIV